MTGLGARGPFRTSLLLVVATVVTPFAAAHTELAASSPEGNEFLEASPDSVVLTFTEPFELRFSRFVLAHVSSEPDLAEADLSRLHGLATEHVADASDASDAAVPFALEAEGDRPHTVTLRPEEPLAPGAWGVAWNVLALDGHVMRDRLLFVVRAHDPMP